MNDFWRDALAIGSAVLTLLGLVYAILQIRKTRSAADAASQSASEAIAESRNQFQRYALSNTLRFVHEVKIHVSNRTWDKACLRISDVADHVAQLANLDPSWDSLASGLREWETVMGRLSDGSITRFQERRWNEFLTRLHRMIDDQRGPFKRIDQEIQR